MIQGFGPVIYPVKDIAQAKSLLLKDYAGFNFLTDPVTYMAAIILGAVIVGLIAGALPALRAARKIRLTHFGTSSNAL